jgi:hypothetical protein
MSALHRVLRVPPKCANLMRCEAFIKRRVFISENWYVDYMFFKIILCVPDVKKLLQTSRALLTA